ncbi:NADPH-dependent F420 reductase [Kitasatospora sp. NPDC058190]|uniref:NADPH-dependent F420 reductase n=1 Tax=Kitasatospora sp. NPDC058190 TaxID=3346371 RepID=UPI0036DB6D4F
MSIPNTSPRLAVIGTGRMGTALAGTLSHHHRDILWASRDERRASDAIRRLGLDDRVQPADHADAIKQADIIFLAIWHQDEKELVDRHRGLLDGKILVQLANPFTPDFTDFTTAYDTSAAEQLAELTPTAHVIGAFKNIFWVVFDQPQFPEGLSDLLVTGDDEAAKAAVIQLLDPLPFRVLDGGALRNNRVIERMTLLSREIAVRYDHYPRVAYRLLGQDH